MKSKAFAKLIFALRFKIFNGFLSFLIATWWRIQGMTIKRKTYLSKISCTWAHQVYIGSGCILEPGVYFKYDGIYSKGPSIIIKDHVFIGRGAEFNICSGIEIEKYSNIASGCKFIDHDHGIDMVTRIGAQPSVNKRILIGEDVWLGANVIVLKGVIIGKGAVVGAGAVVTKSIPPYEIWAGIPARKISTRT